MTTKRFLAVVTVVCGLVSGFQASEQAAIQDPGAPQGWSLTQGLQVVIGP